MKHANFITFLNVSGVSSTVWYLKHIVTPIFDGEISYLSFVGSKQVKVQKSLPKFDSDAQNICIFFENSNPFQFLLNRYIIMAFYAKATLHNYFERAINLWICITRCDFHLPLCTIERKSLHPIDPQSRINLLRSPGCSSTSNFKTAAAAGIARSEAQFAGTHLL